MDAVEGLVAAVAIVALAWLAIIVGLVVAGRGPLAREVASLVPNLVRLFSGLLADPRVPRRAKVVLGITAAYLAFPIDIIPDFVPVAGALDDAIIAALALRYVVRTAPTEIVAEHWHGDPASLRHLLRLARTP